MPQTDYRYLVWVHSSCLGIGYVLLVFFLKLIDLDYNWKGYHANEMLGINEDSM